MPLPDWIGFVCDTAAVAGPIRTIKIVVPFPVRGRYDVHSQ